MSERFIIWRTLAVTAAIGVSAATTANAAPADAASNTLRTRDAINDAGTSSDVSETVNSGADGQMNGAVTL